jgi:hypothetical protein
MFLLRLMPMLPLAAGQMTSFRERWMRYKGQITPAMIDREYVHQVEMITLGGGFGPSLMTMLDYCRSSDFRWHGALAKDRDGVRWCFKTKEQANAFQALFGGERVDLPKADDVTLSVRAKVPAWLRRSRAQ